MKMFKVFGLLMLLLVGGTVAFGGCMYSGYKQAIALDEEVKGAWAQVDNQLQRRFEMIPNLVETVKGFAAQEKDIFLGIAKAREAYFQAKSQGDQAGQTAAAGTFESALSRLLVLRETYPELKSNESFLKLQDSLEGTENRLSVERMRFNEIVKKLNTFVRQPLGRLYARFAGVKEREYFEISDGAKTAPKVDFGK